MSRPASLPIILASVDSGDIRLDGGDCACPTSASAQALGSPLHPPPWETTLYQSPTITVPLNEEYSALLTPIRPRGLAAVNAQTTFLWHQFDRPRSIADVLAGTAEGFREGLGLEIIRQLWSGGFLTDSPAPTPIFPYPDTLTSWLQVTSACNLCCEYCYVRKKDDYMTPETGRAAIEAIVRSARAHHLPRIRVKYSGGEPTLCWPLLTKLHQYALKLARRYDLQVEGIVLSNGVGLTHRMVDDMLTYGLQLMVSVDGLEEYHDRQRPFRNGEGSFARVVRGIEMARSVGLVPILCVTVTERNLAGLGDLLGWILERDLPFSINLYRHHDLSLLAQDLQAETARLTEGLLAALDMVEARLPKHSLLGSLLDRASLYAPHQIPCGVGQHYLAVDTRGRVAKCHMTLPDTVTTITAADPLACVREDRRGLQNPAVDEKEDCRACPWRYWCAGGCPLVTYRATGRYDARSPHCETYRALFPEVARLEGMRLIQHAARS